MAACAIESNDLAISMAQLPVISEAHRLSSRAKAGLTFWRCLWSCWLRALRALAASSRTALPLARFLGARDLPFSADVAASKRDLPVLALLSLLPPLSEGLGLGASAEDTVGGTWEHRVKVISFTVNLMTE